MGNYYTQFSLTIERMSEDEATWLRQQLREIPEAAGESVATLPATLSGKSVSTLLIRRQFNLLLEKAGTGTVRLQLCARSRSGGQQAYLSIEPLPPDGSFFMMERSGNLTQELPEGSETVDHPPLQSVAARLGGDAR